MQRYWTLGRIMTRAATSTATTSAPLRAWHAASPSSLSRTAAKSLLARRASAVADVPSSSTTNTTNTTNSTAMKPWPQPLIESHGDYRAESFLEQHIGGRLYSHQSSLPRLPLPTVQETLQTFLPTALPLATSDEERQSLLEACAAFPSQAVELQKRLMERKDGDMADSSWLQLWWNQLGYLQVRDPVVVNVSYFFHFKDDGTLPLPSSTASPSSATPTTVTNAKTPGIQRGAAMLLAAAEYRRQVITGTLPPDTIGRRDPPTPLCSVAYKYMWNATRIPHRHQDTYRMYDPSLHRHCVVARKGMFFAMDFVDEEGHPLPLEVLEENLERVVQMAEEAERRGEGGGPRLGWLTSSNRDDWAEAREALMRAGGTKMERALTRLESGALLLCLDDEEPVSRKECGEIFWTGGKTSGHNRWFDKSIQLICTNNGKCGFMGEHSMMDGMPMTGLADHITKTTYRDAQNRSYSLPQGDDVGEVENIFEGFSLDPQVDECIVKAKADFDKLIDDHQLDVQSFQGYGSTYIKKAGFSPDAYVQMAVQLATFRLWGEQGGTYEATQMRPFLHGRTETTRSVSPASAAFVKAMGTRPKYDYNDAAARSEKLELLREAVASHVRYIGGAAKGKGVDRHLFGLSMLVGEGEEAPALFSNPLYTRSKTWRVSTSHLTHPNFDNWGFGEVVPDGVGVGYAVKSDSCVFNITARKEHDWTESFSHLLEEALLEMQLLIDMDQQQVASKL